MKKTILTLLVILLGTLSAKAVPALGNLVKVQQPDGSVVTIRLVGDEYLHFNTTADGYSVVKDHRGYYVYAQRAADGQLAPTAQVAHDAEARSEAEVAFLSGIQKRLAPVMTPEASNEQQAEAKRQARAREMRRAGRYDYSKFRGLLILVEFNDKSFSRTDYSSIMQDMVNKPNYTGYTDTNGRNVSCTGSVRDYFSDNSDGQFQPEFDVYGPYKINYSQYAPNGASNASRVINAAINAADADIDFSQYDRDGDGYVDMVYFIFAGNGANYGGNDERLFWPHRSVIYSGNNYVRKDGVILWDYASSVELYGWTSQPSSVTLDGIGTICHEFGHVLGLPDFYDTDYEGSGGESNHPGEWSVMSGGSYFNNGRTPVGYTLFERYAIGFATPQVINEEGSYTLEPISTSNTGYRINTPQNREYFLLENRQKRKWDQYLPGHGMLVFRVDSTNTRVWTNNAVNNNPKHNYFELVRARGTLGSAAYDPFPGNGRVTKLNNTTSPASLLTWAGKETQWGLLNIKESSGVISFDVEDTYVLRELSLPDSVTVGLGYSRTIVFTPVPEYARYEITWSSADESIATVDQNGLVSGIALGSTIITAESNNGLKAECKVDVKELLTCENISSVRSLDEQTEALVTLKDAQVLYVNKKEIYLRDASGSIILRNMDVAAKQNDILNGSLYGRYTTANRMPYFDSVESVTSTDNINLSTGEEAQPRHVKFSELTSADYADMVCVDTVQLVYVGSSIYAEDGDQRARLFNNFAIKGIKAPSSIEDKYFQIKAIYGTHLVGTELIDELYLLDSPQEVEWVDTGIEMLPQLPSAEGRATAVYDLAGRRVGSLPQSGEIERGVLQPGIYIVHGKKFVIK